jgi:outer membrane protein assembly factor BamB
MKHVFRSLGRGIRKLLTNPISWVLVVVTVGAWFLVDNLKPEITKVPIVPGDTTTLTILGEHFGSDQGNNKLLLTTNDVTQSLTAQSWQDDQITAVLPTPINEGTIQVVRKVHLPFRSADVPFVVQSSGLPSQLYNYANPVQPDAPWPTFRRDVKNNGRSPIPAIYQNDQPWFFQTGKGIFSTPVIDEEGIIYVGSADHNFYALNPDGSEKWHFQTNEIIDSAAALPRPDLETGEQTIYVPSGDGNLYHLNRENGELIWSFTAPTESYNSWFEGNVQIGHNDTLYAGNTNFDYYAVAPDGVLKWTFPTLSNAWSIGGIADDGTIYWGSNDTYVYAVDPAGREKWNKRTLGFIAASAAIGSDGTIYIGSFDSYFYALDAQTGQTKWKFKTNDHIYSSAALSVDQAGNTNAIFFGSTDGMFYALNPNGELLWSYDTGDPIRSSPVLGRTPDGKDEIVYFGAGNGRLYALNAADGTRRWSFNTTSEDPELQDRNDLNASPALGETGIVIAGEHGQIWYVPYDYCLHNQDERCETTPSTDLPDNVAGLFYVTPGGNTLPAFPETLPTAAMITLRLIVRENGETVDAFVCNNPIYCPDDALTIRLDPPSPFTWEKSADGHYLYIRPDGFLAPNTQYQLDVDGAYYTGGAAIGNLQLGGSQTGPFSDSFTFRTESPNLPQPPLEVGEDSVTAFEWTRLAAPIPPMLPSLNQIGFDYMDWIMGVVDVSDPDENGQGTFMLWVIGAKRDAEGNLVADPDSDFMLPLNGRYQGNAIIVENENILMPVTGIPIPFNLMEMRATLGEDLTAEPGAALYADTEALSIPTFGPYLVVGGMANNVYEKMLVSGTFVTRPYPENGIANSHPDGVTLTEVNYTPAEGNEYGQVTAVLTAPSDFPWPDHRLAIMLVDSDTNTPVYLNYLDGTATEITTDNTKATITLTLPKDVMLPANMEAVIMVDVFPLARQPLNE